MIPASLLIAYDGSSDANAAIQAAGELFPSARSVVVTVRREPITLERAGNAALIAVPREVLAGGVAALNDAARRETEETAADGARVAAATGLVAEPKVVASGSPWRGLRRVADEIEADVIVCGSRGMGAFSRAVVGSTSTALLHHAGRPVLVDGTVDMSTGIIDVAGRPVGAARQPQPAAA